MNYTNPKLLEPLAQRYVLGIMTRRARRRFGQLVDSNPTVAASVYELESLLLPLAWSLRPVAPSELVWARIVRATGIGRKDNAPGKRSAAWPMLATAMTVGFLAATLGWWQAANRPPVTITETVVEPIAVEPAVAIVADDAGQPLWVARVYSDLQRADVVTQNAPEQHANQDYELWILRDDGVPVSLGVIPQTGASTLQLDADAIDALSRGSTLAVSLEPSGGSPQAVPTGPVLYTTALLQP